MITTFKLKWFKNNVMLKNAYKNFWVPVMGRILSKLIPFLEGKDPESLPTFDIDGDKKLERNN